MKIFTTKQISEIDRYTIEHEPIADIDLMERASLQMVNWLVINCSNEKKVVVFAGPGNNGGDALAIARMMAEYDFQVDVFLLDFGKELKGSPLINWNRLEEQNKVSLCKIRTEKDIPELSEKNVVIDGLFGSGLSRPLEGLTATLVKKINARNALVVAVDIPSGLMGEDNSKNIQEQIVQADFTLTLQFPKISFLFPENEKFLGKWEVLPIGLHPEGIAKTESLYGLISQNCVTQMLPKRSVFGHKGIYGHALLIAGSYGKMGAAILASKACLRAGVGLLTTHVPRLGCTIIQTSVPEAMASFDQHDTMFTEFPDLEQFDVVGIGPGLNQKPNSQRALFQLLETATKHMVIDADALNILALHPEWLEEIPQNSILTPHPGEFTRLVGMSNNSFERLQLQKKFSEKYKVIIVLKGAYSSISLPDGRIYFNSTGNPGMATAGSGDVLTGIILGLLSQGIKPEEAAIAGVFVHGLAGDIAKKEKSEFGLIASDIIDNLSRAFLEII